MILKNNKNILLVSFIVITGCLHDETSLEDLSSAPKAASSSIETNEDNDVSFQLSVTDRENNVTEYFLEETPSHGAITGKYPNLTYSPNSNYYGSDQFKYKVTDGSYDSNIATVIIEINPVNDPPEIGGTPLTEIQAYKEYSFKPVVSDIESDGLTFTINETPSWAVFNEVNGQLLGTPQNSDVGSIQSVVISVSDGVNNVDLASFSLDILPNPWVAKKSMPVANRGQSAAVHNNVIYIFGGTAGSYDNVYAYDPAQDTWQTRASMPIGLYGLTAHTIGDSIYIVAGYGEGGLRNELLEYDPINDSWKNMTPKPTYRSVFSSSVVNGKIYVIGGSGKVDDGPSRDDIGSNYKNYVEIYDPVLDTWTNGSPAPVLLASNVSCVLSDKIYVLGGNTTGSSRLNSVNVYDPATDEWTSSLNMNFAREGQGCVTMAGKLYVFGGRNSGSLSSVEMFDPQVGVWLNLSPMNYPRHWFATESVYDKAYVIGGEHEGVGKLTSVEEFDPSFMP